MAKSPEESKKAIAEILKVYKRGNVTADEAMGAMQREGLFSFFLLTLAETVNWE